ncbi:cupin domain-containing protein [Glaciibacter psychrotolerans]|uniref:Quercetin dioxygenase-like cupin family protein n=1 Tax=Glaciibacter psychrotolerans TaxID=670054 RepID=A0A7Z0ECE6_9MICO|nr:cupin domain-containing protein [Leifsonia psychrotolerans]NYJ19083.1 quercetin dioxygenase-like cupin family protein [Leifsonia psychrotolerans]
MEHYAVPLVFVSDLLESSPVTPGRLGHSTVLTSPDVRVVVLSFEAGHVMKEHRAPKTLILQALDGCLNVTAAGQLTTLAPGAILRLEASLPHEVEALEDSRLMLTLIG